MNDHPVPDWNILQAVIVAIIVAFLIFKLTPLI